MRLRLPGGQLVRARNIASSGKIDNVFEVPATFTTATLEITGKETVGGVSVRVTQTKGFPVRIPPG